jgi:phage gpG-like protein
LLGTLRNTNFLKKLTMPSLNQLPVDFNLKADQVAKVIDSKVPQLVGEMLVDGFRDSFDNSKFNDAGAEPWKEVKRRQMGNPWYGFSYVPGGGANYRVPAGSRGNYPSGKPRRYGTRGGKTNFSPRAATRSILLGHGSTNLRDSIYLRAARRGYIVVASDQPHAQVHNEGGKSRIFGGKEFTMPRRQFMGTSTKLNQKAKDIIELVIKRIL